MRYPKTILLILLLCAAGFLFLRFLLPLHRDAGQIPSKATAETAPGAKTNSPAMLAEKFQQLSAGRISVVPPPGGHVNVDGLATNLIFARRIEDLGNGKVRRLFVVNGGGSYPYHRIEELLQYDASKKSYSVVQQSMMVADHFLVTLCEGRTTADLEAFNKKFNARIFDRTVFPNRYMVQLPEPSLDGVPNAVPAYRQQTNLVKEANADAIAFPMATVPNDPNWSSLWDKQRINCPAAWDWETGSTNIIVAVIDTGVDLDHPDLAAHLWHNPGEAGVLATNGIDDDHNGYIDDWIGWDWGPGTGAVGSGDNNPDDNGDVNNGGNTNAPSVGHGTHCAGIIGAIGNNSNQVTGVCWNVTIMALKAAEYLAEWDPPDMGMYSSKAEAAMVYAADHGAKVVSFSFGGPPAAGDSHYVSGIDYLNSKGVLFVAAAGNSDTDNDVTPYEPACVDLSNVIAVASSTSYETRSYFSNYGSNTVDVFAPGSSIWSTFSNGGITNMSGTSMATPEVAGAIALLYNYNPDLPYLTCKQIILDGVDVFDVYSNKCVSHGRLNVAKSLDLLDAAVPDLDSDQLPNKWEITYFGGTTNANPVATASNGVNTVMDTYIAGINPTNPGSFFKTTAAAVSNGFVVNWDSVTGRVYGVYQSTNLLNNSSFQALETNIVWPQSSYTDTVYNIQPNGFYNVKVRLAE